VKHLPSSGEVETLPGHFSGPVYRPPKKSGTLKDEGHSHGFSMALIEIDGLAFYKMGGSFQFANWQCHNQMVPME
jgi:hypothetical protein